MKPESFVYWLQGFFEISNASSLDAHEVDVIKDHLKLVFQKKTPDRSFSGPFLGIEREVFDEKYIKEALGINEDKFVPFQSNPAYSQAIVFEALSPEERKSDYSFIEYPLYPDNGFPQLFDMENNVPVSC